VRFVIKEFKAFISRGNVIDLAVGIIIGGAFGKIVSSLVGDVVMPIVGIILGGLNFSTLSAKVGEATIAYGAFIQSVVDFLIIALCVFMIIKLINKFRKKKEEEPAKSPEPPAPSKEELLLTEIRDLLKNK
jgi:large conductance mechanosensitive channel